MPAESNVAVLEESTTYAEQHGVFALFEGLLQDLLIKKPEDPLGHLIAALQGTPVPKVIIFGPPSADVRSQCEALAASHGLVHVAADHLWTDGSVAGSEAAAAAKALVDVGKDVPPEVFA